MTCAPPRQIRIIGNVMPPTDDVLARLADSADGYRLRCQLRDRDGNVILSVPCTLVMVSKGRDELYPVIEIALNVVPECGSPTFDEEDFDRRAREQLWRDAMPGSSVMAGKAKRFHPAQARALVEGPGVQPVGVAKWANAGLDPEVSLGALADRLGVSRREVVTAAVQILEGRRATAQRQEREHTDRLVAAARGDIASRVDREEPDPLRSPAIGLQVDQPEGGGV